MQIVSNQFAWNVKAFVFTAETLFMTHRLNVMHASVKFHKYIPYGLVVMAWTWFTIWNYVQGR